MERLGSWDSFNLRRRRNFGGVFYVPRCHVLICHGSIHDHYVFFSVNDEAVPTRLYFLYLYNLFSDRVMYHIFMVHIFFFKTKEIGKNYETHASASLH